MSTGFLEAGCLEFRNIVSGNGASYVRGALSMNNKTPNELMYPKCTYWNSMPFGKIYMVCRVKLVLLVPVFGYV